MPRIVVCDTNILISALLSRQGASFRCLALGRLGTIQSVTCEEILNEFAEKLIGKFDYSRARAHAAADEVRRFSRVVSITGTLHVITADPDDDMIIECAVVGGANDIVTGDRKHLLPLGTFEGVAIVTAAYFLTLVAQA